MVELRIKEILANKGWKQKDLADKMGITEIALSRLLKRGKPNFDALERIAAAIGVEVPDLFVRTKTTIQCPNCGHTITIKTE